MADVAAIEELLDATVLALDGSDYGGTWRACTSPGQLAATRRQPSHLLFDARVIEGDTERSWTGGPCAGDQRRDVVAIEFYYRERSGSQREDWRLAATAAEEAARAVIAAASLAGLGRWTSTGPPSRERVLDEERGAPMAWWLVRVELALSNQWRWVLPGVGAPVVAVYVTGTPGPGATLTAHPVLISGTTPVSYTYAWTIGGTPAGTAASIVLPGDYSDATILVTVTATGPGGLTGAATSQPLGGGGVVDCEVTCADAIQDAVDAATAPLEAEIAQLEEDLAEAIAERDAVQALYDAALITLAERDATIVALNATIATLTAERDAALAAIPVAFANGAASIQSEWRSYAYTEPSIIRDPLLLLSGTPTRAGGVVSATLKAGIVATSVQAGAALVWPVTDAQGRALTFLNGITGFLRVVCPTLPAVGTGIRIAVAVMSSDNPATAQGYAIGLIPHPTSGYLGTVVNGISGTWTVTAASTALTGTVRGSVGSWVRLPGGTGNVYRNLSAAPIDASGVPSGVTGTGATSIGNKTIAQFQITHVALVFMTTLSLASATAVQASPQAALLDVDHADLTGVTP